MKNTRDDMIFRFVNQVNIHVKIISETVLQIVAINDYARTIPFTLSVSISLLFFHFRKILSSAILQVPFFHSHPFYILVLPIFPLFARC